MEIRASEDISAVPVGLEGAKGVEMRVLIGSDQDAPGFYMRQFIVAPQGNTPRHVHDWEHEAYILSGQGNVYCPDGEKSVKAGDCIFVPPGQEHQFINTGCDDFIFLCMVPKTSTV